MRSVLFFFLGGVGAEALRFAWAGRLPVQPDLLLAMVALGALGRSGGRGALLGLALGLVRDLLYGTPWGTHALALTVIGWVVGSLGRTVYRESWTTQALVLFLASVFQGVLLYGLLRDGRIDGMVFYFLKTTIPSALITALLVPPLVDFVRGPVRRRVRFLFQYTIAWIRGYEKKLHAKRQ